MLAALRRFLLANGLVLLGLLALVAWALGTVGYYGDGRPLAESLYLAFQAFFFNREADVPPLAAVGSYLAALVSSTSILGLVRRHLGVRWNRARVALWRRHIVILGLGEKGIALARSVRRQAGAQGIVALDALVDGPFRHEFETELQGVFMVGSATDPASLVHLNIDRAQAVYCLLDCDQTNFDALAATGQQSARRNGQGGPTKVLHLEDPVAAALLEDSQLRQSALNPMGQLVFDLAFEGMRGPDGKLAEPPTVGWLTALETDMETASTVPPEARNWGQLVLRLKAPGAQQGAFQIGAFSVTMDGFAALRERDPAYCLASDCEGDVIILGTGRLAEGFLWGATEYLCAKRAKPCNIHVLGPGATAFVERTRLFHPPFADLWSETGAVTSFDCEYTGAEILKACADLADRHRIRSVLVLTDDDMLSLKLGLHLRQEPWSGKVAHPIACAMVEAEGLAKSVDRSADSGWIAGVTAVHLTEEACDHAKLQGGLGERMIVAFYEAYEAARGNENPPPMGAQDRKDTLERVRFFAGVLPLMGYELSHLRTDEELPHAIVRALTLLEHERWRLEVLTAGRRYGTNRGAGERPALVPWNSRFMYTGLGDRDRFQARPTDPSEHKDFVKACHEMREHDLKETELALVGLRERGVYVVRAARTPQPALGPTPR